MHLPPWVTVGLAVALFVPACHGVDYCKDIKCLDSSAKHTLCMFTTETPGTECKEIVTTELSEDQKRELVDEHNKVRNRVAGGSEEDSKGSTIPQAANMGAVTWNDELAKIAARWALQCKNAPDPCPHLANVRVGQNMDIFTEPGNNRSVDISVGATFGRWFRKEKAKFDAAAIAGTLSVETLQLTQLIWGDVYAVGCGGVVEQEGDQFTTRLVCNYAPAGNVRGSPVYQTGAPCSACPAGTHCDTTYPNLCRAADGKVPDALLSSARSARAAGTLTVLCALLLTRL